jgi:hypothetical protein
MLASLQPAALVVGGQNVSRDAATLLGTESGHPSSIGPFPDAQASSCQGEIWSTGSCNFPSEGDHVQHNCTGTSAWRRTLAGNLSIALNCGDPVSPMFIPKTSDTTMQDADTWFYVPNTGIRNLSNLVQIYHETVGANSVLELAFSINRQGLVEPAHEQMYRAMGKWIQNCYGTPLVSVGNLTGATARNATLELTALTDRVVVREALAFGQRIRQWRVEAFKNGLWTSISTGSSIGSRRIVIFSQALAAGASVRFSIVKFAGMVEDLHLRLFAAYAPCAAP